MHLTPPDIALFYKLHKALIFFVNQRLKVLPDNVPTVEALDSLPAQSILQVRRALLKQLDLIPAFVQENPAHFAPDELDIVASWQHLVAGKFYIFRELKKHTVFLSSDKPPIAYGVVALSQPIAEVVARPLPIFSEAVLMPFRGIITYDGLLAGHNIVFGGGIKRSLNETFKK